MYVPVLLFTTLLAAAASVSEAADLATGGTSSSTTNTGLGTAIVAPWKTATKSMGTAGVDMVKAISDMYKAGFGYGATMGSSLYPSLRPVAELGAKIGSSVVDVGSSVAQSGIEAGQTLTSASLPIIETGLNAITNPNILSTFSNLAGSLPQVATGFASLPSTAGSIAEQAAKTTSSLASSPLNYGAFLFPNLFSNMASALSTLGSNMGGSVSNTAASG